VITLSETRFITRISSEPVPYFHVPHRLTQFRKVRYEYVEAQCNMFGATIEARLAGHSQDTQRMQQSIESLYKRHEGLYEKTENTFGTVVNQVAELKATQLEALEKERRIRKRHEQMLRESAAVLDKKLEEAHRQIDYERQTRKEVAKEAKEAQSKWAMELRKVKDIQKRLKRGLSVDMSTLDLSPEEIPLPPGRQRRLEITDSQSQTDPGTNGGIRTRRTTASYGQLLRTTRPKPHCYRRGHLRANTYTNPAGSRRLRVGKTHHKRTPRKGGHYTSSV
jgi:hypothetical protein